MSNLSNQQINQSFNGLLQVPGGITSTLKTVQDGNGNPTGLQLSSSGSNVTTSNTFVAAVNGIQITGALPRLIADGFGDLVSVKDFGAVGDGVTNDKNAFQLAINSGKTIYVPDGTYKIEFSTVNAFTVPANVTIIGAGIEKTTILFYATNSGYVNCFSLTGDYFTLQNATVKTSVSASPTGISLLVGASSFITLDNCDLDGTITVSGGSASHAAFCINFPSSGSMSDTVVRNCVFHNFSFPFLKTNTSTSTQNRITVSGCAFYDNYGEDCSFNSPVGTMTNVIVENCTFSDGLGYTISANQLYVAFASVSNFVVSSCTFSGTINGDAIHIEQDCFNGSISNNVFNIDVGSSAACVQILSNNIGGTYFTPENIVVSNNAMSSITPQKLNTSGINIVYDLSPVSNGKYINVNNNVINNFYHGIIGSPKIADNCAIENNILNACAIGLFLLSGQITVNNNKTSSCTTGIVSEQGAVVKDHVFYNCTTNADANTRPCVLVNPSFLIAPFAVVGGVTVYKPLVALTSTNRLYGTMTTNAFISSNNTVYEYWVGSVLWDGTTLTATAQTTINPASALVTNVVNNSSQLSISVNSFFTDSSVTCIATMSGSILIGI